MTRTIEIAGTTIVVTLTRDSEMGRPWTARWQQLGKPRETCTRGSIEDAMSDARIEALKIEAKEGEEKCPETERTA